jgi:cytochrome c-type biogenesis protein CcsB
MKKYISFLFSMRFTAILLVIFGFSIAAATFIENDYGSDTARAVVYNTWWFELVLLLGMINLVVKVFDSKLYQRKNLPSFLFHMAFAVIILGAGITRYTGFEGVMSIREGASSNVILSDNAYINIDVSDGTNTVSRNDKVLFSPLKKSRYKASVSLQGEPVKIRLKEFIADAEQSLGLAIPGENGTPMIDMVVTGANGRQTVILKKGEERLLKSTWISFEGKEHREGIKISVSDGQAMVSSPVSFTVMSMSDRSTTSFSADSLYPFEPMNLYTFGEISIVPRDFVENAVIRPAKAQNSSNEDYLDALVFELSRGNDMTESIVWGKKGMTGQLDVKEIGGSKISISYGSMPVTIPFSLRLEDFFLERYPGSNSPSWFESKVTLIDPAKNLSEPRRIFMNNVLVYKGYRFYQSSYDKDEGGTVLSVNRDFWGTWVSYLGYLLMALGMIAAIFNRNSRFRQLSLKIREIRDTRKVIATVILGFIAFLPLKSQDNAPDAGHASAFGELLVQDHGGRIEPLSTLSSEVLRKVSRKTSFEGLSSEQVILGMIEDPGYWQTVKIIRVSNDELVRKMNLGSKYASFGDFVNDKGYLLQDEVEQAYRKKPAYRSKYDNELIKVDERLNIVYMVFTNELFRILPKEGDPTGRWYSPMEAKEAFSSDTLGFEQNIFPAYIGELRNAKSSGDYRMASEYLDALKKYQNKYGAALIPGSAKIKTEAFYNKADIFKRLSGIYGIVGFILLVLHFIQIFATKIRIEKLISYVSWLIIAAFAFHAAGLAMRWYISGHAPWTNGYEALVYISWATILAGILFSRKSKITLAATAILSYLILFVAHMSWMDPEVTNLVPVLKSYWLVIHVAIITASYGFLALGAVMATINLVLMILRSEKNKERIGLLVLELSHIIEMTLIAGLFMVTIGTFLGGVWANESWGRYWGWDAKETWALVTVVVYTFIAHMRLIPGLRGVYAFNLAALLGFGSVIMTYFGVNYYLSGLHSYAAGDPLPVPTFVYYTVVSVAVLGLAAYLNHSKLERTGKAT